MALYIVVCCELCQVDCVSPCTMYIHIYVRCKKLSVQVCHSHADLGIWIIPSSTNENITLCSYYVKQN